MVTYHGAGLYSRVGAELDEQQCGDILQSSFEKRLVYSQKGASVAFARKGDLEQEGRVRLNVIDWRSATLSEIKFGSKSMVSVEDDGWQQVVLLTFGHGTVKHL